MRIILAESVDKESKVKLIEARRKFYFPDFNRGEDPQNKELEELAKQYDIDITPEALIIWFKNEEIFWQVRN